MENDDVFLWISAINLEVIGLSMSTPEVEIIQPLALPGKCVMLKNGETSRSGKNRVVYPENR